jgi:hypothetical protein
MGGGCLRVKQTQPDFGNDVLHNYGFVPSYHK